MGHGIGAVKIANGMAKEYGDGVETEGRVIREFHSLPDLGYSHDGVRLSPAASAEVAKGAKCPTIFLIVRARSVRLCGRKGAVGRAKTGRAINDLPPCRKVLADERSNMAHQNIWVRKLGANELVIGLGEIGGSGTSVVFHRLAVAKRKSCGFRCEPLVAVATHINLHGAGFKRLQGGNNRVRRVTNSKRCCWWVHSLSAGMFRVGGGVPHRDNQTVIIGTVIVVEKVIQAIRFTVGGRVITVPPVVIGCFVTGIGTSVGVDDHVAVVIRCQSTSVVGFESKLDIALELSFGRHVGTFSILHATCTGNGEMKLVANAHGGLQTLTENCLGSRDFDAM